MVLQNIDSVTPEKEKHKESFEDWDSNHTAMSADPRPCQLPVVEVRSFYIPSFRMFQEGHLWVLHALSHAPHSQPIGSDHLSRQVDLVKCPAVQDNV